MSSPEGEMKRVEVELSEGLLVADQMMVWIGSL